MTQIRKLNSESDTNFDFNWVVEEEIEVTDAPIESVSRWQDAELVAGREELAYQQMFKVMRDMKQALQERDQALSAMQLAQQDILQRLAVISEWNTRGCERNNQRIGVLAAMLGHYAGMTDAECDLLSCAAPLRDLGLIGIPDVILHKDGKLDQSEMAVFKLHPAIGAQILQDSPVAELQLAALIANEHHECFDGSGYPSGLAADDISRSARVVALVEFYDAKVSESLTETSSELALYVAEQVSSQRGRAFDPELCDLLLSQLDQFLSARHIFDSRSALQKRSGENLAGYWHRFI